MASQTHKNFSRRQCGFALVCVFVCVWLREAGKTLIFPARLTIRGAAGLVGVVLCSAYESEG